MSKILILGATGSLGRHVVQQALSANHEVSVLVRNLSKLPAEIREKIIAYTADIAEMPVSALQAIFQNKDVVINTAGYVSEGQSFVDLTDHIVTSLETLPEKDRPICWFMAGAALLNMDENGRRGVDFPAVNSTYWPHRANFDRIRKSSLDWRILCPGPMVDRPPLGLTRMRVSLDRLPVDMPSYTGNLPQALALPFFTYRVPEMIVPYADAATLMLENIIPGGRMSRHCVGLALPVGMRGKK